MILFELSVNTSGITRFSVRETQGKGLFSKVTKIEVLTIPPQVKMTVVINLNILALCCTCA